MPVSKPRARSTQRKRCNALKSVYCAFAPRKTRPRTRFYSRVEAQSWSDVAQALQFTERYFLRTLSIENTCTGTVSCPFRSPEQGGRSGSAANYQTVLFARALRRKHVHGLAFMLVSTPRASRMQRQRCNAIMGTFRAFSPSKTRARPRFMLVFEAQS